MRTVRIYLPPSLFESQSFVIHDYAPTASRLYTSLHITLYIRLYYLLINSFLFSYSLIINTSVFDPIVNSFPAIPASKLKIKNLCTRFQ